MGGSYYLIRSVTLDFMKLVMPMCLQFPLLLTRKLVLVIKLPPTVSCSGPAVVFLDVTISPE